MLRIHGQGPINFHPVAGAQQAVALAGLAEYANRCGKQIHLANALRQTTGPQRIAHPGSGRQINRHTPDLIRPGIDHRHRDRSAFIRQRTRSHFPGSTALLSATGLLYNRSQMSKTTASNGHGTGSTIAVNKKARHDFFIEERLEAGIALEGWEVKALRAGRVQLVDSYVIIKNGEAWLLGALITALPTVSTHYVPEAQRTRKLLLHRQEITKLARALDNSGRTLVPLSIYFKDGYAKVEIAVATGKKDWDKRRDLAERDAKREAERALAVRNSYNRN